MKNRLLIVLTSAFLCVCLPLMNGCANSAQTGAAIGGVGGAVIGAVTGGTGGVVVGGLIGAGGGYVVGNEIEK
ncbi:MAG: glycine zipper 2TM domain-containing protein [Sedimentisphaerales bacterium]